MLDFEGIDWNSLGAEYVTYYGSELYPVYLTLDAEDYQVYTVDYSNVPEHLAEDIRVAVLTWEEL